MSLARKKGCKCFGGSKQDKCDRDRELAGGILAPDPSTITRWLQKYRQQGLAGLLKMKKPPGQDPTIKGEVLELLKAKLNSPEGFASYGEIVNWLNENHGLDVSYKNGTLLGALQTSLQAESTSTMQCQPRLKGDRDI